MKNRRIRTFLLAGVAALALEESLALGVGPDWDAAERVFGKPAKLQADGVRRFGWPRTDLHVIRDGVVIEPTLALGSWAAFQEMPAGQAVAMGDLVLLGAEVNPVVSALQAGGIEVLAIHNHLIGETPQILYLHFSGKGTPPEIAKVLKTALERTATPLAAPGVAPVPSAAETAALERVEGALGRKGSMAGRVLQVSVPRAQAVQEDGMEVLSSMGMANALNFKVVGERVATTGDFALVASEVNPVIRELRSRGIEVTALHSHMLDETPRLFFLHFWGLDKPETVGAALKAALERVATAPTRLSDEGNVIAVAGGTAGIGFDDLRFARSLDRILAPAGRTGSLALIDPRSRQVVMIGGFSAKPDFGGGHDEGVTSADEGNHFLFATDRTSGRLEVVDPVAGRIVAGAKLAGGPDYVRFVAPTGELWVTEPDSERIEIFRLEGNPPRPVHAGFLPVPGGPESLVIDASRGRAYTHLWKGTTVALDLKGRRAVAQWPNGCEGSRGIALDEARGFLFVGCAEGRGTVLDVGTGKRLGSISAGNGIDVIDYNPRLSHLYLPGGKSATIAIVDVSPKGGLSLLGTFPTAPGAHCVAADENGTSYVCDPKGGRLLVIPDTFPASTRVP